MKEEDFIGILEQQGWVCKKDEVGDFFCTIDLGEVQLQIIPSVCKRADHFRVSLMPSISTAKFSEAVSFISGDERGNIPINISSEAPYKIAGFSVDDVVRLSDKVMSWARSQNIEEGLESYRDLPTDVKGALPLRHLAALAIAGNVQVLKKYKKSFEQGERLGFVPYVTSDMIERALTIAGGQ
jgi:hypothetical protein